MLRLSNGSFYLVLAVLAILIRCAAAAVVATAARCALASGAALMAPPSRARRSCRRRRHRRCYRHRSRGCCCCWWREILAISRRSRCVSLLLPPLLCTFPLPSLLAHSGPIPMQQHMRRDPARPPPPRFSFSAAHIVSGAAIAVNCYRSKQN